MNNGKKSQHSKHRLQTDKGNRTMSKEHETKMGPVTLRRKAEEKVASQPLTSAAMEELYAKRLLHELEVHQVELQMQNDELNAALAKTEAANQVKSTFLHLMSHELRTPMNGVLGMAQLLELTPLSDEQKQYVSTLKLSGLRLQKLLQDILDAAMLEGEKLDSVQDRFNLHDCINDAVQTLKKAILVKGLSLDVEIDKEIPNDLTGDQLRITQILLHLISNAVKFTSTGGITVSAQIFGQEKDALVIQIAVRDTGIGINAENIGKIFNLFVQAEDSTNCNFGGSGLGLYICCNLAKMMGGSISLESIPGVGSCFKVNIPLSL